VEQRRTLLSLKEVGRTSADERLDALFRAYDLACEPRKVSADFMPKLWQKIERILSTTAAAFQMRPDVGWICETDD
jgi:hypothetical protein